MTTFTEFRKWLWSDWGKPNFLTRLGVPRIVTYPLAYLLGPYVMYMVTLRYSSSVDRQRIRLLLHNPFVLSAYAVFFLAALTNQFVESKYNLKKLPMDERFKESRRIWKDPFVRIFWASFICTFLLFLISSLQFIHQLK